jgi:hypothetical protein
MRINCPSFARSPRTNPGVSQAAAVGGIGRALVEFAEKDAPRSLTHTDPALYRMLRQQITEFRLRGWSCLDLKKLKELAGESNTN